MNSPLRSIAAFLLAPLAATILLGRGIAEASHSSACAAFSSAAPQADNRVLDRATYDKYLDKLAVLPEDEKLTALNAAIAENRDAPGARAAALLAYADSILPADSRLIEVAASLPYLRFRNPRIWSASAAGPPRGSNARIRIGRAAFVDANEAARAVWRLGILLHEIKFSFRRLPWSDRITSWPACREGTLCSPRVNGTLETGAAEAGPGLVWRSDTEFARILSADVAEVERRLYRLRAALIALRPGFQLPIANSDDSRRLRVREFLAGAIPGLAVGVLAALPALIIGDGFGTDIPGAGVEILAPSPWTGAAQAGLFAGAIGLALRYSALGAHRLNEGDFNRALESTDAGAAASSRNLVRDRLRAYWWLSNAARVVALGTALLIGPSIPEHASQWMRFPSRITEMIEVGRTWRAHVDPAAARALYEDATIRNARVMERSLSEEIAALEQAQIGAPNDRAIAAGLGVRRNLLRELIEAHGDLRGS